MVKKKRQKESIRRDEFFDLARTLSDVWNFSVIAENPRRDIYEDWRSENENVTSVRASLCEGVDFYYIECETSLQKSMFTCCIFVRV